MECERRRTLLLPSVFTSFFFLLLWPSILITLAAAETHYHHFVVQASPVKRLCKSRSIMTVNGMFPGPTLEVRNGDAVVVNVVNRGPYNITVHWHGVRQMRTAWADGPEFVTQCPIRPGGSYTYRFKVEGQEGTLWWHAHSSWLRATVYGGLIVRPRGNCSYPFDKPHTEFPILLGEWWNANPLDVVREAMRTGGAPNLSDAYTINGQPGDLYRCSKKDTVVIPVSAGETALFRVVNAALSINLFFSIAGHTMTVVGADASYTKPFSTSFLMLGPGQTTDVLVVANQAPGRYYLAARPYASARGVPFANITTTAVLEYRGAGGGAWGGSKGRKPRPVLPALPAFNDTGAATAFTGGLRSLPSAVEVVLDPVDVELFFAVGVGVAGCPRGRTCRGPNGSRFAASVNNVSFLLPSSYSILQAHRLGLPGVFTADFPATPPVQFDYTGSNISSELWTPAPGTKVVKLWYGCVVQVVLQGTAILAAENHPMHLHGYNFYVVGEGFGNFDPGADSAGFNLVDPPQRNTVGVPVRGWAAVRFVADNPGVWLLHCHLDAHVGWGLATVLLVDDGVGESQSLEPPPPDLPTC